MKNSIFTLAMLLMTLTTIAQNPEEIRKGLHDSYTSAFANEDVDEILTLYTKDASIHNIDGSIYNGHDEIREAYSNFYNSGDMTIELKSENSEMLSDDIIFSFEHFKLKSKSSDDKIMGEVVNLYKMEDGKWKIHKSYRWSKPEMTEEED